MTKIIWILFAIATLQPDTPAWDSFEVGEPPYNISVHDTQDECLKGMKDLDREAELIGLSIEFIRCFEVRVKAEPVKGTGT